MRLLLIIYLLHAANGNHDWDLLIFTQHWPTTACLDYEESNKSHFCERPKIENSWTIHGLWPTKLHTIGPGFCNTSLPFNVSSINSIYNDLINAWPNLEGGKAEDSLWDHEWSKHGTCAVSLDSLNTEEKYFKKGLDFFKMHNMSSILSQNGIIASDSFEYNVQSIHDVVFKVTNTNPNIQCILERHTKKPYLFEIRICFDKNLSLVNCDGTLAYASNLLTNCPKNQTIKYPLHVHQFINPLFDYPMKFPEPPVVKRASFGRTLRIMVEILQVLRWIV